MNKTQMLELRQSFRSLLLTNPNYFGTLEGSNLDVVSPLKMDTTYEEIGCVGFDPKFDRLQAVVYVKEPDGYGGSICSNGTPEYVRFYLSFDDGTTWQDQGVVSFRAYNIPEGTNGRKRLEYAASLKVQGLTRLCRFTDDILCRAILSWNNAPPANTPDFVPVWGDVHNTCILTEPLQFINLPDLTDLLEVNIPKNLFEVIDFDQPLKLQDPVQLSVKQLAAKYEACKENVPVGRFAFKQLQAILNTPTDLSINEAFQFSELTDLGFEFDFGDLFKESGDGNTDYEELECVGLYPNEDLLVATFRVKRVSGYSGDPCSTGSTEYVAFWADFDNNGTFEEYLGTASVTVYDYDDIPEKGLEYSVTLPIDLTRYRQPCNQGPKLVPIRAILSWETPPDTMDSNYIPYWGNREETVIHVTPGPIINGPEARISIMGGIPTSMINTISGYTNSDAIFAVNGISPDSLGRPCTFGGLVVLKGPLFEGYKYRVLARALGTSAWQPVVNDFPVTNGLGSITDTQSADSDGKYTYLSHNNNIENILAWWNANGNEIWEVRLELYNAAGDILLDAAQHRIRLDNVRPEATISITSGAGDCGGFKVGDTISGRFVARDQHFNRFTIAVLPTDEGSNGMLAPSSGTVQTSVAGDTWTLQTNTMVPCGYVVKVTATDRTILNSARTGRRNDDEAGFCLE